MAEFNIATAQVEAISRKEWLRNRRTAKASIIISGGAQTSSSNDPTGIVPPSVETLSALSDVNIQDLKSGDILHHDGSQWKNTPLEDALGDSFYNKEDADNTFVKKGGDKMTGALEIQGADYQLRLTGLANTAGDRKAALIAGSEGAEFGGIHWSGDVTDIQGLSERLSYNGEEILNANDIREYVEEKIENIAVDVDLSDVSISEEVEVAEDASIITKSEFSDTPIAEEIASAEDADTLTYGDVQRVLRVFELDGWICFASSIPIYDDELISLARNMAQGWSGKQGWSVSQQFNSQGGKGDNPTHEPHLFALQPWATPNIKQPNGMYYYHLRIDGNLVSPSTLLQYFIATLDGYLGVYWGKRRKKVAFGLDSSGKYKRATTLRFGVAVGSQIAPFRLVIQSKFTTSGGVGYLDSTTWPESVQFRV